MQTYPEKHTFSWEEKPRLTMTQALLTFANGRRQRGSEQRKASYIAVIHALEHIQHEHDPETISTTKLKELLIAAAREQGWYAQDMKALRASQPRLPFAPPGTKACRKCREVKPADDFKVPASPARARSYGWKEDTTQKAMSHLCTPCRKANHQAQARRNARSSVKRKFDLETLRTNPALTKRVAQYQKLINELRTHDNRTRAAFTSARKTLHFPEGDAYEYQFRTDELRKFYESKRVLVKAAIERLEVLFGEAAPLPDAWGMLLTQEEQLELANLHSEAILSSPSATRTPSLWKAENRKPKDMSEE
jgi:hypothetical protein